MAQQKIKQQENLLKDYKLDEILKNIDTLIKMYIIREIKLKYPILKQDENRKILFNDSDQKAICSSTSDYILNTISDELMDKIKYFFVNETACYTFITQYIYDITLQFMLQHNKEYLTQSNIAKLNKW